MMPTQPKVLTNMLQLALQLLKVSFLNHRLIFFHLTAGHILAVGDYSHTRAELLDTKSKKWEAVDSYPYGTELKESSSINFSQFFFDRI